MNKQPKITKFEAMALMNWAKEKQITEDQLKALVEIIGASKNETVAIELLLGIYEPIKISKTPLKKMGYDNRTLFVFLDFNKFTGTITYGYNKIETKKVWALKTELHPTFKDITPEMEIYSISTQAQRLGISPTEFEALYERVTINGPIDEGTQLEDTCDLKDWQ